MKELLQQYASYNRWADRRLVELIDKLPHDLAHREVPSSFSTLYHTIVHMWDASGIWWQRIRLQEVVIAPSTYFKGSVQEAGAALLQQDRQWDEWVHHCTEAALQHVFQYYNSKREYFKQPQYQVVMQVFNHGTYHRGQLVNMLRYLDVKKIPGTDYITWSREA